MLESIRNIKFHAKKGMIKGISFKKTQFFWVLFGFFLVFKPKFGLSFLCQPCKEVIKSEILSLLLGALTEETNTFNGVVVKYSEPPEARKPKRRWRFYVFKVHKLHLS